MIALSLTQRAMDAQGLALRETCFPSPFIAVGHPIMILAN